ncbi:hypothetical protein TWF694_010923 [Orbilia ellipsospora]|uniref:P-loop containing nucleoside triphosphate hydrolase protein n=1 Tax=Orbilia ellipsospora TaxID=2528407 RepID=A0AAV9X7H2_9PEZI
MNRIQNQPINDSDSIYRKESNLLSSPPIAMLQTFAPPPTLISGMHMLTRFLDVWLYFNPTNCIMTTCALIHSVNHIWSLVMHLAACHEASITVEEDDPIYTHVMAWLTAHVSTSRLQARTAKGGQFCIDDPASMEEYAAATKNGIFNLIEYQKALRPKYEIHLGEHNFQFQGRSFWIRRGAEDYFRPDTAPRQFTVDKNEYIRISCWGKSTIPIQEFLQETKRLYLDQEGTKIPIFKAVHGVWGSRWKCAIVRHARHIDNISLDKSVKTPILNDVREFLKPTAAKWYANRGIPYRRGYLFHGPPGTGKTSFTLALAGTFGLPIYNLSLGDPTITEEKLLQYFAELPRRCILLIEDIDTVAISKKRDSEGCQRNNNNNPQNNNISLSGLLNAIDGIISHEGRILVMTTNHPEHLDPALTRHGRVDLKIYFGLATREQISSLFINMYSRDYDEDDAGGEKRDLFREKITAAAETFTGFLPTGKFSPAEIQGFLTLRKNSYLKAVMEVEQWGRDTLAAREVNEAAITIL